MIFAMREALRIVHEEGLEARFARHAACAQMLYEGLEEMDMSMLVAPEHRLASLTTVCAPAGMDEMAVRKRLMAEYNIEIAGGLGVFKGTCWRVGLMGHSARPENVVTLLGALRKVILQ
jgi:alanine-glyoxylate transaminase/serine-glyoxylate transaminase/serine-pyruvate transaminase